MPTTTAIVLLAGALAAVHLFAGRLRLLEVVSRRRYLSMAGGVSVAYVFVHLLPEITERQAELAERTATTFPFPGATTELALFLVALLGFAVFYGLEQFVVRSRRRTDGDAVATGLETKTSDSVFWLHVGSFVVYNALIGYLLLHREETGLVALLFYAVAMALHFLVTDSGLREHHREAYSHLGRWILTSAIVVGVAVGFLVTVPELILGLLLAFLGGSVILNVVKEEVPERRESSFWSFAGGLAGYTVLLLIL